MANQSAENRERANNGERVQTPPAPTPITPSEVNSMVGRVVSIIETAPEGVQRRVLEGARIALGLAQPQQRQQPTNQQKR